MVTTVPYPAKGHAGITDAAFSRNFWIDAGGQPTYENWTVAQGQVLLAGHVLGLITATNQLVESDPAAGDGSENVFAILNEDLDTSATGINAPVEVSVLTTSNRMINFNALVYNAAWDKYALRAQLSRRPFATRTPIYSAL